MALKIFLKKKKSILENNNTQDQNNQLIDQKKIDSLDRIVQLLEQLNNKNIITNNITTNDPQDLPVDASDNFFIPSINIQQEESITPVSKTNKKRDISGIVSKLSKISNVSSEGEK